MGLFSKQLKSSTFFESEYTDKSIMSVAQVMSAHANWKSRLNKFIEGTLGYKLDSEMLLQANDTELGRWILQADTMEMGVTKKELLTQLYQANHELHHVASRIAQIVQDGSREVIAAEKEKLQNIAKKITYLLMDVSLEK